MSWRLYTERDHPMALFRNKYRIESSRLAGWDYSKPGYYFVTICTRNRKCFFSEIKNGIAVPTPIGKIAIEEWERTGSIRKNVTIHEYAIMPNHVHGIVQIVKTPCTIDETPSRDASKYPTEYGLSMTYVTKSQENSSGARFVKTPCHGVSTEEPHEQRSHWKSGVLGALVGQFKIQVIKRAHLSGFSDFQWHPRFHEHIIRDMNGLIAIRQYIRDNPANWDEDEENPLAKSPRFVALPNAQRRCLRGYL
jgi:putative transposase